MRMSGASWIPAGSLSNTVSFAVPAGFRTGDRYFSDPFVRVLI